MYDHHNHLQPRRVSDFSRDELETFMHRGRQLRARAMRDTFASLLGLMRRRPRERHASREAVRGA